MYRLIILRPEKSRNKEKSREGLRDGRLRKIKKAGEKQGRAQKR